jgi:hypothetical protein
MISCRFLLSMAALVCTQSLICQAKNLNEVQAEKYLAQKIEKSQVYSSWAKLECLNFYTEDSTMQYFDISVHEKHSEKCSGDLNTWPVADRFRVYRKGNSQYKTLWLNLESDQYLPFKQFVKSRITKVQK